MPWPPAAPATVTDSDLGQGSVGVDLKLVDDPIPSGLDIEELPIRRGRAVNGAWVSVSGAPRGTTDRLASFDRTRWSNWHRYCR